MRISNSRVTSIARTPATAGRTTLEMLKNIGFTILLSFHGISDAMVENSIDNLKVAGSCPIPAKKYLRTPPENVSVAEYSEETLAHIY
jgi:hypothetical protein